MSRKIIHLLTDVIIYSSLFEIERYNMLKECPFCGSTEVEIVHCEEDCCGAKPRWIQCVCGCELGGSWNNDEEAINTWNTRV